MRDYPNMSYCMYENTLLAVNQILSALQNGKFPSSVDEQRAARELIMAADQLSELIEEAFDSFDEVEA